LIGHTIMNSSALQYLPAYGLNSAPNQEILPLTARVNDQDSLEIGGCSIADLVQKHGSPLYIVDEVTLRIAAQQYRQAWQKYYPGESLVIYASKAWNCLAICHIVTTAGLGIDVVSGGELLTALQAGAKPQQVYFHGNNKSVSELELAIEKGCNIVVDNWWEIKTLGSLAAKVTQPVSIMLRLTPGIECHTHEYIRTGHLDSKFGFDPTRIDELFTYLSNQTQLRCMGLHAHIGSQIFEQQPHQDLAGVMVGWFTKAQTYGLPVTEINVGGGLGVKYTEDDDPQSIDTWVQGVATAVVAACRSANLTPPKIISEPGRSLVANSCVTAYTIGSNKEVPGIRQYLAVDGGMSDNPRPITYQSVYRCLAATKMSVACTETVTVAGKHCESGDVLIHNASLPPTQTGDILVVPVTGAYNYSMASNYNRIPRPAAILVKDGDSDVIIDRETYADLVKNDRLPERLA
jgi:diaminopimelate decarboxylase